MQLPLFAVGTTHLHDDLAFECHGGQVTYFNGHLTVFTHARDDQAAFRLFTSQLVVNGDTPPKGTFSARLACPKWRCSARLTRREADVLELLTQGYANEGFADRLAASFDPVRAHSRHI